MDNEQTNNQEENKEYNHEEHLTKKERKQLKRDRREEERVGQQKSAKTKKAVFWGIGVIIVAIIVAGIMYSISLSNKPGELDGFAQCLEEKEAVFYGTFWCPNCTNQKRMFGRSERLLPYVECSTPNGNGTNVICQDEGITAYPTWEFADGHRETGTLSLERLADNTGCTLPEGI
jgi:hypothetical protein